MDLGEIIEAGASIYVGRTSPFDRWRSKLWGVIKCRLSICIKEIVWRERMGSNEIIEAGASTYVGRTSPFDRVRS